VVIGAHSAERAAIFRTIRAEIEKLHHARIILGRGSAGNSGNFLNFLGKSLPGGGRD